MNRIQALHAFWSSFGWNAYDSSSVPDRAIATDGHYITYELSDADFGDPLMLSASLWMRSKQWDVISLKALEIYNAIGWGGKKITTDGGFLWIKRGRPFSARINDEDDEIRRIYLNIEVDFINA